MRIFFLALLLLIAPARAATLEVITNNPNDPALIILRGTLRMEDVDAFRFKIGSISKAVVAFDSDGGNLVAGIRIGTDIRLRSFVTLVPSGARCASACAIAWLGGARRFMAENAMVGFHAAYRDEGGRASETGAGNAVLGAYLSQIGLPESAIVYVTQAPPNSMTWLTMQDAVQRGIEVHLFSPAPSQQLPPEVAQNDRAKGVELEQRTKEFVSSVFTLWSAPDISPRALDGLYADQVTYYGRAVQRPEVLADKEQFIARWPQRRYTIRDASTISRCDGPTCTLTGSIDWASFNFSSLARARGVAEIEYRVDWSGAGPKIIYETSQVTYREKSASAVQRPSAGWWVILASFQVGDSNAEGLLRQSVGRVTGAAYLCGFEATSDLSANFMGFKTGYRIVLIGAFADKAAAEDAKRRVAQCIPGVYLKQATRIGG
jgi:hypothetical protein